MCSISQIRYSVQAGCEERLRSLRRKQQPVRWWWWWWWSLHARRGKGQETNPHLYRR